MKFRPPDICSLEFTSKKVTPRVILNFFACSNLDAHRLTGKCQIDISKIDYFTDQTVKCRSVKYRTVCKMQTRSCDVTKFTE